jgi:hypothetical protein
MLRMLRVHVSLDASPEEMRCDLRRYLVLPVVCLLPACLSMQGQSPAHDSGWLRVQQLPLHTKVHISSEKKAKTCPVAAVDEQSVTCANGTSFSRAEIKSIKLTRYGWSTLGGLGIGFGVGATIAATGPNDSLTRGGAAGLCVIGGAVIGGVSDMFRGPTIYQRTP